jgi:RHS repeat-associated protein
VAVTKYVYDGDTVLQEYDANGVTLTEYTSTGPGYGDLLSAYDGSAAKYYEPDALGSTEALADQSQAVTDRWRYRAFGAATQTAGTDSTPFTWVGRYGYYADTETRLYQLGNGTRYYDPVTAQFLSQDAIDSMVQRRNLYSYVENNPINAIDPSGLQRSDTTNSLINILYGNAKDRTAKLTMAIANLQCPLIGDEAGFVIKLARGEYNPALSGGKVPKNQTDNIPDAQLRAAVQTAQQKIRDCIGKLTKDRSPFVDECFIAHALDCIPSLDSRFAERERCAKLINTVLDSLISDGAVVTFCKLYNALRNARNATGAPPEVVERIERILSRSGIALVGYLC